MKKNWEASAEKWILLYNPVTIGVVLWGASVITGLTGGSRRNAMPLGLAILVAPPIWCGFVRVVRWLHNINKA